MPSFPSSLPPFQVSGYSESPAKLVIRSQMDQGPAKTRRRSTAGVKPVKIETPPYTAAQVAVFDDFFVDDIASGASTFTMENPRTETTETFRFVSEPVYTALENEMFRITLDLEQMP
jgi:hypothetical protein